MDLLTPLPLLAYWLHDLSPFLIQFGENVGVRWYGLGYLAGFFVAYWLVKLQARRGVTAVPEDQVSEFIFWACLLGVFVGGRLGSMLLYDFEEFRRNPALIFQVWKGGMASHGGITGLAIYLWWYARRHKISWLGLGDQICAVAPVGIFFVRCANFINGELYGRVTSVPWAVLFPKEILDKPGLADRVLAFTGARPANGAEFLQVLEGFITRARDDEAAQAFLREILSPRHPSQLYEAGLEGLLLFAILYPIARAGRAPQGLVAGLFFVLYAVMRITVEFFREPDAEPILAMTRGQFYSLPMIAVGLGFIIYALRRGRIQETFHRTQPQSPEPAAPAK